MTSLYMKCDFAGLCQKKFMLYRKWVMYNFPPSSRGGSQRTARNIIHAEIISVLLEMNLEYCMPNCL